MGTYRSPDEVADNYIKHMGVDLGTFFNALYNELAWLYTKWSEYVELYGKKPSRVELLNDSAPTFFRIVQDCLFDDTLLHITRLTDSPKSAGKKNLSIQRLPGLVSSDVLKNEIEGLVKIAVQKAKFCRDWRNRRIAHIDLNLALSQTAIPLEPASRKKVKETLEAISSVLNKIELHYMGAAGIKLDNLPGLIRGAEALLYILDDGITADKERRKRIESGKFNEDDIKQRDL